MVSTGVNTFVFSWDNLGLDQMLDISDHHVWEQQQLVDMLGDRTPQRNPAWTQIQNMVYRAQRHVGDHSEVYWIQCPVDLNEKVWRKQWALYPDNTKTVIRECGQRLFPAEPSVINSHQGHTPC